MFTGILLTVARIFFIEQRRKVRRQVVNLKWYSAVYSIITQVTAPIIKILDATVVIHPDTDTGKVNRQAAGDRMAWSQPFNLPRGHTAARAFV